MASLLLGPILRYLGETAATVWVETDVPCKVAVLDGTARTFEVEGHHYALVRGRGPPPRRAHPPAVELDGERRWPESGSELPPSSIRPIAAGDEVRLAFGSCRTSPPHEPPHALSRAEHPSGQGVDALRALALRALSEDPRNRPDALLMLGDQVYADDLSPAMREVAGSRGDADGAPKDELLTFPEYALAYREAWSEPAVRWLLSTVPTLMIFDDHEIHAEWKISQEWLDEKWREPWYERRLTDGLMAYWVYQHVGNLTPDELDESDLFARVLAAGDAARVLRPYAREAAFQGGASRWSFCRDLGSSRLIVIDSRAGRELARGGRRMIDEGEWEWIERHAEGDFDHLLLASSVPFLLGPGLHHLEAWNEAVCDGAWGARAARLGERLRRAAVLDHWASFQESFRRLAQLLTAIAAGRLGNPPVSIVLLSGDVHHSYLAEVGFPRGAGVRSAVWQAVCSPYRKELASKEKLTMRVANSRIAGAVGHALARLTGVADPPLAWRLAVEPSYDNHVAILELAAGRAELRVETTAGSDWRRPILRTELERTLA